MSDYLNKGKSLLENKEFSKAIKYFQAAIEESPNNECAYLMLGKTYYQANKAELAKKVFFTLLSINPNNAAALAEIQKLSFSSHIPANSSDRVNINAKDDDPIIRVIPPGENGTGFWMTEQMSGNKLFFLNTSLLSKSERSDECALVCPEEESWTGFEEPKGLVVIPEEVPMYGRNIRVTWIDECVFSGNKEIRTVVIPDSVKIIGRQAFMDTKLSKITLPQQLEYIGVESFARTKISEVVFPPRLKEIDDFAFVDTQIQQVVLPDSVRTVGHYCFSGCILDKVHLNDGIVSIGYSAFDYSIIPEVDVPSSVESIGRVMFGVLTNTKVKLHCEPPEIWECAFDNDGLDFHIIENINEDVVLDEFMVTRDNYNLYRSDRVWRNIDVKSFNH